MNATCTGYSHGIGTVPGGLPIFRNGEEVIGGIGVAGFTNNDVAEYAATVATQQTGFFVNPLPTPGGIYLNGFLLPFLAQQPPTGVAPGPSPGAYGVGPYRACRSRKVWLVGPNAGSVLSATEVGNIIMNAEATATLTRAAIRCYPTNAEMVISVADLDGTIPGLNRMHSARIW